MSAYLLADGFSPNKGSLRSTVDELWHVDNIEGWSGSTTQGAVYSQIPYRVGVSFHQDITDALCVSMRLVRPIFKIEPLTGEHADEAIVHVFFSNSHGETRRFRSSTTGNFRGSLAVPYWTNTGVRWVKSMHYETRPCSRRLETRYPRNGSLTDEVITTYHRLAGSVFRFPDDVGGVPFQFQGHQAVDHAPGQSRLVLVSETSAPVLAMPAGTINGQNQALPALDFLDEWFAPEGGVASPLPIVVRRWQHRWPALPHSALPLL